MAILTTSSHYLTHLNNDHQQALQLQILLARTTIIPVWKVAAARRADEFCRRSHRSADADHRREAGGSWLRDGPQRKVARGVLLHGADTAWTGVFDFAWILVRTSRRVQQYSACRHVVQRSRPNNAHFGARTRAAAIEGSFCAILRIRFSESCPHAVQCTRCCYHSNMLHQHANLLQIRR